MGKRSADALDAHEMVAAIVLLRGAEAVGIGDMVLHAGPETELTRRVSSRTKIDFGLQAALDECIGDLPLIEKVVASQLAKNTCPRSRLIGHFVCERAKYLVWDTLRNQALIL